MTLQQLKYVVATAEKGTVSEAAQSLFISQPSLTNAIRELEKEIEKLEAEMQALQEEMASPEVCQDYQLMQEKCAELEQKKLLSAEYSDEWLVLSEEMES